MIHPIPDQEQALFARHLSPTPVSGCPELCALQTDDPFALWHEWETITAIHHDVPFWAIVWPAAALLGTFLLHHSHFVCDKQVVEIGCGCGVAAIAACRAGARSVVANDIDPYALYTTNLNASINGVSLTLSNQDLLKNTECLDADCLLIADMFYTRDQADLLIATIQKAVKKGATVLIADGKRPFSPQRGFSLLSEETMAVNKEIEGTTTRDVRILMAHETIHYNL